MVMLTPDEIRLALDRASDEARGENCSCLSTAEDAQNGVLAVINVLLQVLPELVAEVQTKTNEGSQDTAIRLQQRESGPFSRLVRQKWCYGCRASFDDDQEHFGSDQHRRRVGALVDAKVQEDDSLWQCAVCQEMVPEHRQLEHASAHTLRRAESRRDAELMKPEAWDWDGAERHQVVNRPCPDCTPEQPCDRARWLMGDAPQEPSAEYRLHRQSCTECYKTQLCDRARELTGG